MKFNYQKEKAKFLLEWAEEEKLLRLQNVDENIIEEIYEISLNQFKADRNYYLHKEEFDYEDEINQTVVFDEKLELLEQIENPHILKVLKGLKKSDYEIIVMICVKGMTQTEIATHLGQSTYNICKKLKRIKKHFENG